MSRRPQKLLLIGPRAPESGGVGGVIVLFEALVQHLGGTTQSLIVCDSNARNYRSAISMIITVCLCLLRFRSYTHVSLHGTARDYLFIAPMVVTFTFIFNKNYSLRKFAGNFDEYYDSKNCLGRFILRGVMRCSKINYFETWHLVNKFKKYNPHTFIFPNVRPRQAVRVREYKPGETLRVLFLSQVMRVKGVLDAISAVKSMDAVHLTIAGPLVDSDMSFLAAYQHEKVDYVGILDNSGVYEFMSQFHCLLLPTYYDAEGYPGVIIEALMIGMPVVATRWRSIPELLGNAGCLVDPRDPDDITKALIQISKSHKLFASRSLERSRMFDEAENTARFMSGIRPYL